MLFQEIMSVTKYEFYEPDKRGRKSASLAEMILLTLIARYSMVMRFKKHKRGSMIQKNRTKWLDSSKFRSIMISSILSEGKQI